MRSSREKDRAREYSHRSSSYAAVCCEGGGELWRREGGRVDAEGGRVVVEGGRVVVEGGRVVVEGGRVVVGRIVVVEGGSSRREE
jgi:hypothetical protein